MKNEIQVVEGVNFSGRSDFLRSQCTGNNNGIYIGEIPSNYISGVSPTVKAELDLYSSNTKPDVFYAVQELIEELGFSKLFENNPYLLSGGEQVILTILSGILLEPKLLALDTCIEQLSNEWKKPLFKLLENKVKQKIYISDNRIKDYGIEYSSIQFGRNIKYETKFCQPSIVDIDKKVNSCNISIKDLRFRYKKNVPILEKINLDLRPGTIYFLKGTNGAGKSTLAKILSGILKVRNGSISIDGQITNPYRQPGKLFGYSFQNPDEQLFSKTVYNEIIGLKRKNNLSLITEREKFLRMFELHLLQNFHPAELPYVLRKRIALAATLANDRPWYIIDEPTIGQDDSFVDFLFELFNQMAMAGKGIIIISHSQAFIDRFQAKTLFLDNGIIKT